MLFTILIFIIILGLLVFVHEAGHFLVAIWNGIKAEEFGFGFPPRAFGFYKDETTGKYRLIWGSKDVQSKNTLFSMNWLPLGGFVRIKGEDGQSQGPDSFAGKSAWIRVKVLGAGVFMNFIFAWLLVSIVLMIGFPQAIDSTNRGDYANTKIYITNVLPNTPAAQMGIMAGDQVVSLDGIAMMSLEQVSKTIKEKQGMEVVIEVNRLGKVLDLRGTPRVVHPDNEGALGIGFTETAIVKFGFFRAFYEGALNTFEMTKQILFAIGRMVGMLFGGTKVAVDVTGPVGIVYMTKQMSDLGFVYLLQFAAILSINLGIVNILPFPALDGGRIFFILLEKLKGRPVTQKVEMALHQIGFMLLLLLMAIITVRDFSQFKLLEKLSHFF
jgi:regulator of sigma E protease